MISGAAFVFFFNALLYRSVGFVIDVDNALCTEFFVCVNKYPKKVSFFSQNVICASSYDNARTFLCKIKNIFALDLPVYFFVVGRIRSV